MINLSTLLGFFLCKGCSASESIWIQAVFKIYSTPERLHDGVAYAGLSDLEVWTLKDYFCSHHLFHLPRSRAVTFNRIYFSGFPRNFSREHPARSKLLWNKLFLIAVVRTGILKITKEKMKSIKGLKAYMPVEPFRPLFQPFSTLCCRFFTRFCGAYMPLKWF